MSTLVKTTNNKLKEKFDAGEFVSFALEKIGDSVADMVITVLVLGPMLYFTNQLLPSGLIGPFSGLLVSGMVVQLLLRIVHRFDDHYTTDELAERMIEMEHEIKEQLTRMEANQ